MRKFIILIAILIQAPSYASSVDIKEIFLPEHGSLILPAQTNWSYKIQRPSNDSPPTIRFSQKSGERFEVLITPFWRTPAASEAFGTPEGLLSLVETSVGQASSRAEEDNIQILKLDLPNYGFYFSATDKKPEPSGYKYLTQGAVKIGELVATFTVLSSNKNASAPKLTLEMLRDAKHDAKAVRKFTVAENYLIKDGKYALKAKGSKWSLEFPAKNFKLLIHKQGGDGRHQYYQLSNDNRMVVSFFIEPIRVCRSSEDCRQYQINRPGPSLKASKNIQTYNVNPFSVVEYFLDKADENSVRRLPKLKNMLINQNNINAHYVKSGYWVDIHISKMFSRQNDNEGFMEFLRSINFVPE